MKLFDKSQQPFFLEEKPKPAEIQYDLLSDWTTPANEANLQQLIKEWFIAIKKFETLKVLKGIEANLPLTAIHEKGYTLLSYAEKNGALTIAKILMRTHKLNPAYSDVKNNVRYSAFHCACLSGRFGMIEILLEDFNQDNRLSIDMPEPKHHQSPLQLAAGEHHFGCARQMIAKYKPELSHADYRGRTILSTLLGCYVDQGFDQLVNSPIKLVELEKFTLEMLANENAFNKLHETAKPAFLQFTTCELALDLPSGTPPAKRINTVDLLITIMKHAPNLTAELLKQADKNPEGELEAVFKRSYIEAEAKLTKGTQAELRQAVVRSTSS